MGREETKQGQAMRGKKRHKTAEIERKVRGNQKGKEVLRKTD